MRNIPSNMLILALGQALTSTAISLLTLVSSLAGSYLAPLKSLSTLPVSATVIGAMLMIYPASIIMGKLGRKNGFMLKAAIGVVGGIAGYYALVQHSFYILILGAFILGIFSSFGQYYRFAAIEVAKNQDDKHLALSIVTGAGVIGGILGPMLGGEFAQIIPNAPFAGAFIVLSVICVVLAISQCGLSSDLGKVEIAQHEKNDIVKLNQTFFLVSLICAIGFFVMTLVMNAAPLALHHSGFSLQDIALVLQIHFVLMYFPSFFNPLVIRHFGVDGLILLGIAAGIVAALFSFVPMQTQFLYMLELGLAGIAWNFIFNGGTLLLVNTYPAKLKTKAQGINSLIVYSGNVCASFGSGVLITQYSWKLVNALGLLLLIIALYLILIKKIHQNTMFNPS